MRLVHVPTLAAVVVALGAMTAALPARADDFGKRITLNVAPVYLFSTNGDVSGAVPPGETGVGYGHDNPTANTGRINYGIDFKIDAKTHLSYSHSNVAYQLGRIETLGPKTSFVSGAIYDYTDAFTLSRGLFPGLSGHVGWSSHQRQDVTGLCLNQKFCPVNGVQQADPLSIDERYYTAGFSYDFGPKSIIGSILNVSGDAKYVPRSGVPRSPAVALGGLGHYVGSQTVFPYSATLRVPIIHDASFIPFVNYTNLPVLYHDSAVPEAYRGIVFGLVKVIDKNLTLSYTNLNIQTCRCIARVPPPDNLRLALGILSLDIHTGL